MKKLISILLVITLMFTTVIPIVAEGETYTVTFYNADGSVNSTQEGVAVGDTITYPELTGSRMYDVAWSTSADERIYAPDTLKTAADLSVYAYQDYEVQGFEATVTSSTHYGMKTEYNTISFATDYAYAGNRAIKFTNNTNITYSGWGYRQTAHIALANVAANTSYKINFKYYVPEGNTSDIIVRLFTCTNGNPRASEQDIAADFTVSKEKAGEWLDASYTFTTAATLNGPQLNMFVYPSSKSGTDTAIVYIDEVSYYQVKTVTYNYDNGTTSTAAYGNGDSVEYPAISPGKYQNAEDYMWSLSNDEFIEVPEKMGTADINVYQYNIEGVYGAENLPEYMKDSNAKGVTDTTEQVYSGYKAYKFENNENLKYNTTTTNLKATAWGHRLGNQIILPKVNANTDYRVSFKYYVPAGNTDTVTLTPTTQSNNNPSTVNGAFYTAMVLNNDTTGEWLDGSFTFTTGEIGTSLNQLYLVLMPTSGNGAGATTAVVYIDHIIIETVTGQTTFFVGEDATVSDATVIDGKVTLDYWQYTGVTAPAVTYDDKEVIGWTATEGSTEAVETFEAGATYYPITKEIFTVTFDYGDGTTDRVVYNEGDTIEYPKLTASEGKDILWSKSATSYIAVDATIGRESITVYKYTRNVVGFENYTGASYTLKNRFQVTDEKAFAGDKSMKFVNGLYGLLTSEPSDWVTAYTNYYTLTDGTYTKVTGDTAPEWAENTYYVEKYGVAVKDNNISLGQVVNKGKTYKISYKYYVEAGNTGNFTVTAYVGGVNAWNATGGCSWTTTGYNRTYTPAEADGKWHTTEIYINALPEAVTGKAYLYLHGMNSNHFDSQTTVVYIDEITVEETVAVTLNRNGETEVVYGAAGEALPDTGVIDKNWYTNETATVVAGNVFPEATATYYSAAALMNSDTVTNGNLYFGAKLDAVTEDSKNSLKYTSTEAVTDQSVMYRLGQVEDNTTYKVTFSYKSTADFGFNFATGEVANLYAYASPVEGDISYSLVSVSDTSGEWKTVTAVFTTALRGVVTESATDDTLITDSDWLYIYILDQAAQGDMYIADIKLTKLGQAISAGGASKLTAEKEAETGTQAIRYYFGYETEDGSSVRIGNDTYNVVARGFIYVNGNFDKYTTETTTGSINNGLINVEAQSVVESKKDNFNTCWAYADGEMTFSTYVTKFTSDMYSQKLMVRAFITILVDGKEMNVYSSTINRSVEAITETH